jgi:nucleoside phosphorylase
VLVVSAGVCGALAPELAAGALVVPEVVLGADGRRRPTAAVGGARRHGTLLTVDRVLEDAAGKARRWLETGALAKAMDAAAAVAARWAMRGLYPNDEDALRDLCSALRALGRLP